MKIKNITKQECENEYKRFFVDVHKLKLNKGESITEIECGEKYEHGAIYFIDNQAEQKQLEYAFNFYDDLQYIGPVNKEEFLLASLLLRADFRSQKNKEEEGQYHEGSGSRERVRDAVLFLREFYFEQLKDNKDLEKYFYNKFLQDTLTSKQENYKEKRGGKI